MRSSFPSPIPIPALNFFGGLGVIEGQKLERARPAEGRMNDTTIEVYDQNPGIQNSLT